MQCMGDTFDNLECLQCPDLSPVLELWCEWQCASPRLHKDEEDFLTAILENELPPTHILTDNNINLSPALTDYLLRHAAAELAKLDYGFDPRYTSIMVDLRLAETVDTYDDYGDYDIAKFKTIVQSMLQPLPPVTDPDISIAKREASPEPTWQPTSCTVPGATCADSGNGGSQGKRDVALGEETPAIAKRDPFAVPEPRRHRVHKWRWSPTSCTSKGITCAGGDDEGHGYGPNDTRHHDTQHHRPANIVADQVAQTPVKIKRRAQWFQPSVCTAFGITCATAAGQDGTVSASGSASGTTKRDTVDSEVLSKRDAQRWQPSPCTVPGVTCAEAGASGSGGSSAKRDIVDPDVIEGSALTHPAGGDGNEEEKRGLLFDLDAFVNDEGEVIEVGPSTSEFPGGETE